VLSGKVIPELRGAIVRTLMEIGHQARKTDVPASSSTNGLA